ncbi:hypothetical protein ACFQX4_08080 [Roseomonas sp. GCM10028921]
MSDPSHPACQPSSASGARCGLSVPGRITAADPLLAASALLRHRF